MTSSQGPELLAATGGWADGELFVCDVLSAVHDSQGEPLGLLVDTETPDPLPAEFIRVAEQTGRGGVSPNQITGTVTVLVEVYGQRRRDVKRMSSEASELLLGLDRGGAHRGILVDACYNAAADAPEDDRDEDDRRRSSLWTIEWRRHFGPAVYL